MALLGLGCLFICALSPEQKTNGESTGVRSSKSTVILREMTEVPLKFAEDVNSRTAKQGQAVEFVLAQDLKVGDAVVAKAGSRAIGTVVHSKTPDFWGEAGELNVRITFLKAGNTKVPLRGASGEVGTRYVVVRGSQAVMKRGTPVKAYVDTDTEVQPLNSGPPNT